MEGQSKRQASGTASNGLPSAAVENMYDEVDVSEGKEEIRLLAFSPHHFASERTGILSCSLVKTPLYHAPAYSAISYAWGDANVRRPIGIGSVEVAIPAQAEEALKYLLSALKKNNQRHEAGQPIHLWIDALCFNQANNLERSQQVAITSEIYASAEQVLVFLGLPFDGHLETMKAITDTASHLRTQYRTVANLSAALEIDTELPDTPIAPSLTKDKLLDFYSSPWFPRLWVLQEVALSRIAIAFYGSDSIVLMDAILLARWIAKRDYQGGSFRNRTLDPLSRSIDYTTTLYHLRCFEHCQSGDHPVGECSGGCYGGRSLDWLLQETHDHLNSEPRDKIYALLGLCTPDVADRIKPDYDSPLSTVYTQALRVAFTTERHANDLDFMRLARILGNKPTQWYKENNWPTWVPLWYEVYDPLTNASGFPWWIFDACRNTPAQIQPTHPGDPILKCDGLMFDEIEWTSRSFLPLGDQETTEDLRADFENAFRELSSRVTKAITPNGQSYTTALGLTLACGYYPFVESEYSLGETHLGAALQQTSLRALVPILSKSARDNLDKGLGDEAKYLLQFQIHSRFRSVLFTRRGYLGLGSQHIVKGDVVCVPFGSAAPWALRKEAEHHLFLGPCYVHGIMGVSFSFMGIVSMC